MTAEFDPKDLLTIERKASAKVARKRVLRSIWQNVPFSSNAAFGELLLRFNEGADVNSFAFAAKYEDTIIESLEALRALSKQGFIESAFDALDAALPASIDKPQPVPVFPEMTGISGEQTILDAYSFLEPVLRAQLADCKNAARLELIKGIIQDPDAFARLGLFHHVPGMDIKSIIVGPAEYTFRAPTKIKGVDIRIIHPKDRDDKRPPVVNLIANPLSV